MSSVAMSRSLGCRGMLAKTLKGHLMFIRPPFKAPPGSTTSWDVKFPKGRKPFKNQIEANAFAAEQRAMPEGWAEISMVVSMVVSPKS